MSNSPTSDYYAVLGVAPTASPADLRRAWRRFAARWHPDRAGAGATPTFQQISAAYTVLSDPVARAAYDRRRRSPPAGPESAPGSSPAVSKPPTARRSTPAVMLRRLCGPLNSLLACGVARYAEEGVIDLIVTAADASRGGMAAISMRVPVRCSACAADPSQPCSRCGSSRGADELFSAWLAVPPDVADGAILEPSELLDGMLRPVSFRVRIAAHGYSPT